MLIENVRMQKPKLCFYRNAFVLFAIFLFMCCTLAAKTTDSLFRYQPQIGWEVFRGEPTNDTSAAMIATTIYVQAAKTSIWTGRIRFKTYAVMDQKASWVGAGFAIEPILQHEQRHFDIAEICARALEAELNQLKIFSIKSPLLHETVDKWLTNLEAMQKEYDAETKNGRDAAAQNAWNNRIREALVTSEAAKGKRKPADTKNK